MRILLGLLLAVLVLVAAAVAYAVSPAALPAIARPDPSTFDAEAVRAGERLALIGNCADCHTRAGGQPYAGGRPIPTPFGTLYGTNITPDEATGIGSWSPAAFRRAMHRGLDREGQHLYPAFPYHHFTKVSDDDVDAIYAYLMSLEPAAYEPPANELAFPFNIRPLLAGWKLLYLEEGRFAATPGTSEAETRGAYLVDGLGHCGGCHTPRNMLQAEDRDRPLRGEVTEGWYAPAIAGAVPAAAPWTEESLAAYLTGAFAERHGVALGPMAPVAENLGRVPPEEAAAIAAYLVPRMKSAGVQRVRADAASGAVPAAGGEGAVIYATTCAQCHKREPQRLADGLPLADSTSLRIPEPGNLLRIVAGGVKPPSGHAGPFMPGYRNALTEAQAAALAVYLRERFTDLPPWEGLGDAVGSAWEPRATHTAGTTERTTW